MRKFKGIINNWDTLFNLKKTLILTIIRKHIENTHTQHKSIQTVNNNYLGEYDRQHTVYSPTYQPNYWPTTYEHHVTATAATAASHAHAHSQAHWYYSQNTYYAARQWWWCHLLNAARFINCYMYVSIIATCF